MRLIVAAVFALAVISSTSCGETQTKPAASLTPAAVSPQGESESDGHAEPHYVGEAHVAQGHAAEDSEVAHERGHAHVDHDSSPVAQHLDVHPTANAHAGEQHAHDGHNRQAKSHAAHGHAEGGQRAGDDSKKIAIGDKVPDFEVTIAGKTSKLSELQKDAAMTANGTLVLTFWCSFCHSCRDVEHALDALAKQYHGTAGVIAVDASAGETTDGVAEFAKQRELTLPIALDRSGAAADIFGTRVTTTTVVIDKNCVLRYRGQFGDEQHAYAQDALRAVLAGDGVPVQETRQKG